MTTREEKQAYAALMQAQANFWRIQAAKQSDEERVKPSRQLPQELHWQPHPQPQQPPKMGVQWFGTGMGPFGFPVVFEQQQAVQFAVPQQVALDTFMYVDGALTKVKGEMRNHPGHILTLSPGYLKCINCNARVYV